MSDPRRILLVGATGMVGRRVIARGRMVPGLELTALARRALEMPRGGWACMVAAPVEGWPEAIGKIAPDAVICALGTTIAQSGRRGLAETDRDLVLQVARAARLAGARQFVLVSSVGANSRSHSFYLRMKGEAEKELRKLGFARVDVLRPGLLRGVRWHDHRAAGSRLGERIAQIFAPLTDALLWRSWRRFRSISAGTVAAAALQAVRQGGEGRFVLYHDELRDLASRLPRSIV